MKRAVVVTALLALVSFGFAGVAMADSTTAGGAVYTFTNEGSEGSGGFFVQLTIGAAAPTASGTLDVFAVQFFSSGTSVTSVSLASQTGTSGWSVVGPDRKSVV